MSDLVHRLRLKTRRSLLTSGPPSSWRGIVPFSCKPVDREEQHRGPFSGEAEIDKICYGFRMRVSGRCLFSTINGTVRPVPESASHPDEETKEIR